MCVYGGEGGSKKRGKDSRLDREPNHKPLGPKVNTCEPVWPSDKVLGW